MEEQIKVSVIIPVYNVESYLARCLRSVIGQSLTEIEIICIDDNSEDCSVTIIEDFRQMDSRIKCIRNTCNQGPAYSRNQGIYLAQGEYIFFLDSDDFIPEDALEKLYNLAEKNECEMVMSNYISFYENENIKKYNEETIIFEGIWNGMDLFIAMSGKDAIRHTVWGHLYKRDFICSNNLYFINGILHEDIPYIIKAIIKARKIAYTNQILYVWYHRENSITTSHISEKHIEGRFIGYFDLLNFWQTLDCNAELNIAYQNKMESLLQKIKMVYAEFFYKEAVFEQEPGYRYFFDKMINSEVSFSIKDEQIKYITSSKKIVIYGTGKVARLFSKKMQDFLTKNTEILGFVVSRKTKDNNFFMGYTVFAIEELQEFKEECLVIVATTKRFHEQIKAVLDKLGFLDRMFLE